MAESNSCSIPPSYCQAFASTSSYYQEPCFPIAGVCNPTNYYAAQDQGGLTYTNGPYETQMEAKCSAACDASSQCQSFAGVITIASDSSSATGTCFLYNVQQIYPRQCVDSPSRIVAYYKQADCATTTDGVTTTATTTATTTSTDGSNTSTDTATTAATTTAGDSNTATITTTTGTTTSTDCPASTYSQVTYAVALSDKRRLAKRTATEGLFVTTSILVPNGACTTTAAATTVDIATTATTTSTSGTATTTTTTTTTNAATTTTTDAATTTTDNGSCTPTPTYSPVADIAYPSCYDTSYYRTADQGQLSGSDLDAELKARCRANCDADTRCTAYEAVLRLADDSNLGYGNCFIYDHEPAPRSCSDSSNYRISAEEKTLSSCESKKRVRRVVEERKRKLF